MNFLPLLFPSLLLCIACNCDKHSEKEAKNPAPATQKSAQKQIAPKVAEKPAAPKVDKIKVSPEGAKIDPPVSKEKIPEGAYYCDMGSVHYARMQKGDNTCPLCKMALKQMGTHSEVDAHKGHNHN